MTLRRILVLAFLAVALHLKASFDMGTLSRDDGQSQRRVMVVLLALYTALFALWFAATIGLALMVFLLLALFCHTAYCWPKRQDARLAELPLAA